MNQAAPTQIVLTVDVEPSIAGAYADPERYRPQIDAPVWGAVQGKSQALGFLIETLQHHNQQATFFVETNHTRYFSDAPMGAYVERLMHAGQDVQLHVHPTWNNFAADGRHQGPQISDNCHEIDAGMFTDLLGEGQDIIARWTGQKPTAMRTGNFAVSRALYPLLRDMGLKVSSNICAAYPFGAGDGLTAPGGLQHIDGVWEAPVACFADQGPIRRGRPRPMQVNANSFAEMRTALNQGARQDTELMVLVTHPFEYLKWRGVAFDRLRTNAMVQGRLRHLCRYIAGQPERFAMRPLSTAVAHLDREILPPRLKGQPLRALQRTAWNVVNDHVL